MPIPRSRRVLHLIRIFAFESCEVDRRHTEKVLRPVVQTIDLKLRLLRRVTGQRRIVSTQALYAYVKPVERNVGRDSRPKPEARWLRSGGTPCAHQVGGGRSKVDPTSAGLANADQPVGAIDGVEPFPSGIEIALRVFQSADNSSIGNSLSRNSSRSRWAIYPRRPSGLSLFRRLTHLPRRK